MLVSNIIFTKNRPLQLEGYLRSLYRFFPSEHIQTYVIYKVELFEREYESVFSQFPGIAVIRESNFHRDMLNVLDKVDSKYILFGIDDVIFYDGVDLDLIQKTFEKADDDIFGFTMRFNPEPVKQDGDHIDDIQIGDEKVYRLDWPKGKTKHTRYPFELCCTIYRTKLVKKIISNTMSGNSIAGVLFSPDSGLIKAYSKIASPRSLLKKFGFFFSPNTLESWPCRWSQNNSDKLPKYTYFKKLCASAIQINLVNTSTANKQTDSAEHTVEALNKKYRQGYRLDIDHVINNKPSGTHGGQEHFKLTIPL